MSDDLELIPVSDTLPDNTQTKWVAKFESPKGVGVDKFRNCVSAAYTAYIACRGIPSVEEIYKYSDKTLTKAKIAEITLTDEFKRAIESRGISWRDFNGISAAQQYAISIITNPTLVRKSLQQKLRMAGVTYAQYRAWLKQPTFAKYMNDLTEGMLSDHIGDAHTVLVEKALTGDLNAIKYMHELNGRHDPNRQQVQDVRAVMEALVEIITQEVKDPETLTRISNRLSLVVNSTQAVGNTVRGEISGN